MRGTGALQSFLKKGKCEKNKRLSYNPLTEEKSGSRNIIQASSFGWRKFGKMNLYVTS